MPEAVQAMAAAASQGAIWRVVKVVVAVAIDVVTLINRRKGQQMVGRQESIQS